MTIRRQTDFASADRYLYDFGACSYARGWAQVDTRQDASYYGTWTHPDRRQVFTYCEGDLSLVLCDTDEEYVAELRRVAAWNVEHGYWLGIDAGFGEAMRERFVALGVGDLLHPA